MKIGRVKIRAVPPRPFHGPTQKGPSYPLLNAIAPGAEHLEVIAVDADGSETLLPAAGVTITAESGQGITAVVSLTVAELDVEALATIEGGAP